MKTIQRISTLMLLATLASACGGQAYRETTQSKDSSGGNTINWGGGSGNNGSGTSGSGTNPNPTPSSTPGTTPAYTTDFSLLGKGGVASGTNTTVAPYVFTSQPVDTDNLLKVKVTAKAGAPVSMGEGNSNFTANYACVEYKVTVLGVTRTTGMLRVPGSMLNTPCAASPESAVLDFSDRLGAGHNTVNVKVTEVRYDFYCMLAYSGHYPQMNPANYCPTYSVYHTHTVNGSLAIQVNGTSL